MNKIRFTILGCLSVVLCCSCSMFGKKSDAPQTKLVSGQAQSSERYTDISKVDSSKIAYNKNELNFFVSADNQLNKYQNNAHALYMCVYQLKDPNAFNQLVEEKDGLSKLLDCTRFDASVANSKRIVVQPGQNLKDVRDRAEGARFIGIATGYYGAEKVRSTHLGTIPLKFDSNSGLQISIELGAYEINAVTVK